MNVNTLYRLASLLDTDGKYLEADVVLESMMRFAKGGRKWYGNQARPKPQFNPMPGTRPAAPVAPQGIVPFNQAPQAPPPNQPFQLTANPDTTPQEPTNPKEKWRVITKEQRFQKYLDLAKKKGWTDEQFAQWLKSQDPDLFDQFMGPKQSVNTSPNSRTQGPRSNANPASSAGPETGPRPGGNTGRGPTNPAGAASAEPGPRPGGPRSYRGPEPKYDPIPKGFNAAQSVEDAANYRKLVLNNPGTRPEIAAKLELLVKRGLLDPQTGKWTRNLSDMQISDLERFYKNISKAADVASDASKAGKGAQMAGKAAEFAARAKNAPGAQSIANALGKMGKTLSFLKPLTKLLPFLGFALSIPDFVRLCNRINQEGWEPIWNDPYDRAKAIGAISNTVAAAVSIAPGPLTPVAAALAAIGMGSDLGADAAVALGDAAEGGELKMFGRTIKQKSKERQQQEAFEAGLNAKNIDPQVQSALDASKRMIMSGSKIIDIMNDPKMKSIYTWLGTGDARDTQFKVQVTALRKSLRAGGEEAQPGQNQQQGQGPYLNQPPYSGGANQQGQSVYNNAQQQQQQMPTLNNYNDLLYKAYVDTVQSTNITLENLKNYRQQIITKIQALAKYYPNINAQQAITALDNRIRKYSAQAQPT